MIWIGPLTATAGLTAVLLSGCASTTVASPGDTVPLVSPEATFVVFKEAWQQGDIDTLLIIYAAGRLDGLVKQLQEQGREAVSQWYRRDANAWEFTNPRWNRDAKWLAYLTATLSSRACGPAAVGEEREITFSFAWVRGGWRITGMRTREAR